MLVLTLHYAGNNQNLQVQLPAYKFVIESRSQDFEQANNQFVLLSFIKVEFYRKIDYTGYFFWGGKREMHLCIIIGQNLCLRRTVVSSYSVGLPVDCMQS